MRVSLAVHGGLAAAINRRRPPRVVDTAALPAAQAQELHQLVAVAIRAQSDKPTTTAADAPDAMGYTITVEQEGATRVLNGSDVAATPALQELLAYLEAHTR